MDLTFCKFYTSENVIIENITGDAVLKTSPNPYSKISSADALVNVS